LAEIRIYRKIRGGCILCSSQISTPLQKYARCGL